MFGTFLFDLLRAVRIALLTPTPLMWTPGENNEKGEKGTEWSSDFNVVYLGWRGKLTVVVYKFIASEISFY